MKLLIPSNQKELAERSIWFKKPIALKLKEEKGVEFGFEIKEPLSYLKRAPDAFWGLHLPNNFATVWYYYPKKRKELMRMAKRLGKLKPNYAVLHGIHLTWEPPAREYIHRYFNRSDSAEYFKVFRAQTKLLRELKKYLPVRMENYPLDGYYMKGKKHLPETYLYTGAGRFYDLLYFKRHTNADILIDVEHLWHILNLLNRNKNYANLPIDKFEGLTEGDKKLSQIFGFDIKKYFIPHLKKKITIEEAIKRFKAKYYHLSGSSQAIIPGKKVVSHLPITPGNKTFIRTLKAVLAQKPEVLVMEVASKTDGPAWNYLRTNEAERSFENLCGILLDEL